MASVACSGNTTWYVTTDGKLFGCGNNDRGQQGSGNTTNVTTFTQRATGGTPNVITYTLAFDTTGVSAGAYTLTVNAGATQYVSLDISVTSGDYVTIIGRSSSGTIDELYPTFGATGSSTIYTAAIGSTWYPWLTKTAGTATVNGVAYPSSTLAFTEDLTRGFFGVRFTLPADAVTTVSIDDTVRGRISVQAYDGTEYIITFRNGIASYTTETAAGNLGGVISFTVNNTARIFTVGSLSFALPSQLTSLPMECSSTMVGQTITYTVRTVTGYYDTGHIDLTYTGTGTQTLTIATGAQQLSYLGLDVYDWTAGSFTVTLGTETLTFTKGVRNTYTVQGAMLSHYEGGTLTDSLSCTSATRSVRFVLDATNPYSASAELVSTRKTGDTYVPTAERWVDLSVVSNVSFDGVVITKTAGMAGAINAVPTLGVRSTEISGLSVATGVQTLDLTAYTLNDAGVRFSVGYLGTTSYSASPIYLMLSDDMALSFNPADGKWKVCYGSSVNPIADWLTRDLTVAESETGTNDFLIVNHFVNSARTVTVNGTTVNGYWMEELTIPASTQLVYTDLEYVVSTVTTESGYKLSSEWDWETFWASMLIMEIFGLIFLMYGASRWELYAFEKSIILLAVILLIVCTYVIGFYGEW